MNNEKLAASTENRTFYFYVKEQSDNEIRITMYNTPYTLVCRDGKWENHASNYFSMAQHLIEAVVDGIGGKIKA